MPTAAHATATGTATSASSSPTGDQRAAMPYDSARCPGPRGGAARQAPLHTSWAWSYTHPAMRTLQDRAFGILVLVLAAGCAGPGSSFKRPMPELLMPGMSRAEVVAALGKPGRTAQAGRVELLLYGWDDPTDGRIGAASTLTVKLVDDAAVAAYWDNGAPPMNPPTVAEGIAKGLAVGTSAAAAGVAEAQERQLRMMETKAVVEGAKGLTEPR